MGEAGGGGVPARAPAAGAWVLSACAFLLEDGALHHGSCEVILRLCPRAECPSRGWEGWGCLSVREMSARTAFRA